MEVPSDLVYGEDPSSWSADGHLLAMSSYGRDQSSLSFLLRMLIPSRGPTLILIACKLEGSRWMGWGRCKTTLRLSHTQTPAPRVLGVSHSPYRAHPLSATRWSGKQGLAHAGPLPQSQGKKVKLLSHVRLFATPWTVAYQAPPSWDFPGKSTGVGCHCLLQGIFLTQG